MKASRSKPVGAKPAAAKSAAAKPVRRKTASGKPLLDEGKKREIVAILTVGCAKTVAAQYVGCSVTTIRRAALTDPEFAERIGRAEPNLEITHLKNISAAATDARHWRAAAWALERRFPQRYGQRRARTITPEQISQVLEQFAEIVTQEVTEAAGRQKILMRIQALSERLKAEAS